jgi:hypothetical protein
MRADDESCLHFFTVRAILNAPFWILARSLESPQESGPSKNAFSMRHFVEIKFWLKREFYVYYFYVASKWATELYIQTLERYLEAAHVQANSSCFSY